MPASITMTLLLLVSLASDGSKANENRSRRPVALVSSPDGARLFVANRGSGSVSVVDPSTGSVVAEPDLARGLADLAVLPDGRLLAVDREGDALLVLKPGEGGDAITVEARMAVAADPVSVLVAPDGSRCIVASLASDRLSVISLVEDQGRKINPKLERLIPLPFAPRLMVWLDSGSRLAALDAFGGRIALIDPLREVPESIRTIPGHNLRGVARSPDGRALVVAHQTLNKLARTSFEDVHWGSLLGNHLRVIRLAAVLDPGADLLQGSRLIDLGRTGRAAGDPGAIRFDRQGRLAVALAGVHEVGLLADISSPTARRVPVGQGPSAVLPSKDGSLIYVLDAFDDSITVVDVATASKLKTIPLGPRAPLGPVERGERLFADARISHDGWMSCSSCHAEGRAVGLAVDTLSDGGFGAPKRVTSLLGVGSTPPWTWLGKVDRLEDQVRKSVETTMRGRSPTAGQVDDLTAYLRSLSPPRLFRDGLRAIDAEARGLAVFETRKCGECHAPPGYTSEATFDVGLVDEVGHRKFNPPSLRGVAARGPYLHDGRAATLPDVFLRHGHPRGSSWSNGEVEDLTAFLKTL